MSRAVLNSVSGFSLSRFWNDCYMSFDLHGHIRSSSEQDGNRQASAINAKDARTGSPCYADRLVMRFDRNRP